MKLAASVFDSISSKINSSYKPKVEYGLSEGAAVAFNLIMGISFGISIIAIGFSMIMYVMSAGNPDKTKQAWNAFIYGIIAFAVAIGALTLRKIFLEILIGASVPGVTEGLPDL